MCGQACPNYAKYKASYSFAISYEKSEWWSWFLHADKHKIFPQIDTMILMSMVSHFLSSQNSKCAMSLQSLKKEARDEVDFLHAINFKVSSKLI